MKISEDSCVSVLFFLPICGLAQAMASKATAELHNSPLIQKCRLETAGKTVSVLPNLDNALERQRHQHIHNSKAAGIAAINQKCSGYAYLNIKMSTGQAGFTSE